MDHVGYLHERDVDGLIGTSDRTETISGLFRAHHRRLVGLASLLVDDRLTAEDIVQEAFAGLYRRWHGLRDPRRRSPTSTGRWSTRAGTSFATDAESSPGCGG